jgi:hypothetical protein
VTYCESDIQCAAFLLASGLRLLRLESVGPSRYGFVFDDPEGLAPGWVAEYHDGARTPAKKLLDSLRELKNRLYSEKGRNNGNNHKSYY